MRLVKDYIVLFFLLLLLQFARGGGSSLATAVREDGGTTTTTTKIEEEEDSPARRRRRRRRKRRNLGFWATRNRRRSSPRRNVFHNGGGRFFKGSGGSGGKGRDGIIIRGMGRGKGGTQQHQQAVSNYYGIIRRRRMRRRGKRGERRRQQGGGVGGFLGSNYFIVATVTRPAPTPNGYYYRGPFPDGFRPDMIRRSSRAPTMPTIIPTAPPLPSALPLTSTMVTVTVGPRPTILPVTTAPVAVTTNSPTLPIITNPPTTVATTVAPTIPVAAATTNLPTTIPTTTSTTAAAEATPFTGEFRSQLDLTFFSVISTTGMETDRNLTPEEYAELETLLGEFYTELFQSDPMFATDFVSIAPTFIAGEMMYTAGAMFPPGEPPSIRAAFVPNIMFSPTTITPAQVATKLAATPDDWMNFLTYLRRDPVNQLDRTENVNAKACEIPTGETTCTFA